ALNSISPYLPEMAASFPDVNRRQVGLYVGTIASTFALAQFVTNFFWGWLSDRIGRKPVVMLGTILTALCFVGFGLSRTLWQAILAQALMGLVNGNQGVISTCLGEITDRSNQSKAFLYLPVIYGLGGITGPAIGG
ncbi:MFS transporter, partial [Bacteroides fragilis]|uniref:MFS transporter n=1 Tax=Bacteroides fragilis TaxID=817 RepID=UPI001FBAAB3B